MIMASSNNTGYLLQRLAFLLSKQSDQVLQEQLGIGFSQFRILMVLGWNPSVRQKHIADKLGQTEAAVSRQIKLLKQAGLLTSKVNPENRREHITTPTTKGEKLCDKALSLLNDYHAPMFAELSEKQRERLHQYLSTMHYYASQKETNSFSHIFE
jgi:DNA-binding MarR family transcriptional regulator